MLDQRSLERSNYYVSDLVWPFGDVYWSVTSRPTWGAGPFVGELRHIRLP